MANSLQPWVRDYLILSAETYGANISSIPSYLRPKKIQITKFLTYDSENEATVVWAEVSDTQHIIPLKLTKEALSEYRESLIFGGQRITQQNGAIISIKGFRPILTRVPQNNKVSSDSYLVLESTSFSVLGSSGEATFGNPMPITQCPDIQLWTEGLKSDGGAGNILKERKIQRNAVNGAAPNSHSMSPSVQHGASIQVAKPEIRIHTTRDKIRDLAAYNAQWQYITKDSNFRHSIGEGVYNYNGTGRAVEGETKITPPTLGSEMDASDMNPPRSRSGTPLPEWEPTPSKRLKSPTDDLPSSSEMHSYPLSSWPSLPTPAQRVKTSIMKQTPEIHSSFPSGNETVLKSISHRQNTVVPRKIPRPTSPVQAKQSGPARILAPNSDTSGTQSQGSQEEPRTKGRLVGMDIEEAGDYPWIDLWRIRDIMARTMKGRLSQM